MIARKLPLLLAALLAPALLAVESPIPPAFGPYVGLKPADFAEARSFIPGEKLVGTYYFYWYCADTKEHILNGDGSDALTDHPAAGTKLCYHSVAWHKKELSDMIAAGIDIVLPVFWGSPAEHKTSATLHWSFAGLPPLVQAREELLREGKTPPRIGLFYDTSTLQNNAWHYHADLTSDYGRRFFYGTVRDFFSCLPPKHWAMVDGKPIVLLYAAAFAQKWDAGFVEFTRRAFAEDFGRRAPWLAPQDSWNIRGDATCAWGGALGQRNPGIGELGPGYDHSAVPGRTPLVMPRDGGRFYETQWLKFLRRPANFVMLETWNEFHEGTDLCESKEYGRQYIELTRKYAELFKRGWRPPPPVGPFAGTRTVSITLGATNDARGLRWVDVEDGRTTPVRVGGRDARGIHAQPPLHPYLYFAVDDSWKSSEPMNVTIEVEYFDAAPGSLAVEFDGSDLAAPLSGAYTRCPETVRLTGTKAWKNARFLLDAARLSHGQNGDADFRFVVSAPVFAARRVTLEKR